MIYIIKKSLILGAIIGAIFGICSVIPLIDAFLCFIIYLIVGVLTMIYLKQKKMVGILTDQDSIIIGSVSGFSAFITASLIYLPLKGLINFVFKNAVSYGINIGSSLSSFGYGLFVLIMLVFFMASLSALFNAFSALLTNNIYKRIENNPTKDNDKFTLD